MRINFYSCKILSMGITTNCILKNKNYNNYNYNREICFQNNIPKTIDDLNYIELRNSNIYKLIELYYSNKNKKEIFNLLINNYISVKKLLDKNIKDERYYKTLNHIIFVNNDLIERSRDLIENNKDYRIITNNNMLTNKDKINNDDLSIKIYMFLIFLFLIIQIIILFFV